MGGLALTGLASIGWRGERSTAELAWLGLLALGGPIIWVLFDAITTGNPLYSLTGTQETVESLKRQTGPVDLVLYGPRRLGEVMQWPGMVGGFGGLVLGICLLRRRSALGFAAVVLALLAFAFLAAAGLAIIARYTMLAGAILSIFFALALLGWRFLDRGNPWRLRWQVFAGIVLLMVLVWLPNQWNLDKQVHTDLTNQGQIENDLTDLVNEGAFSPECGPIAVPNHRAVPRLAFGLDVKPTDIVSASRGGLRRRKGKARRSRLLRRAGQPVRDPQLHPRPERQDRLQRRPAARRVPRSRRQRELADLQPLRQLPSAYGARGGIAGTSKPRRKLTMPPPSQLSLASPTSYSPGSSGTITLRSAKSRVPKWRVTPMLPWRPSPRSCHSRWSTPVARDHFPLRRVGGAEEARFGGRRVARLAEDLGVEGEVADACGCGL